MERGGKKRGQNGGIEGERGGKGREVREGTRESKMER